MDHSTSDQGNFHKAAENCGSASINRVLFFSQFWALNSQQFRYFHTDFQNLLSKEKNFIFTMFSYESIVQKKLPLTCFKEFV